VLIGKVPTLQILIGRRYGEKSEAVDNFEANQAGLDVLSRI